MVVVVLMVVLVAAIGHRSERERTNPTEANGADQKGTFTSCHNMPATMYWNSAKRGNNYFVNVNKLLAGQTLPRFLCPVTTTTNLFSSAFTAQDTLHGFPDIVAKDRGFQVGRMEGGQLHEILGYMMVRLELVLIRGTIIFEHP